MQLRPDLIAATGDMKNTGDDGTLFVDLAALLVKMAPVYCSLGNHELAQRKRERSRYQRYCARLKAAGAHILGNARAQITRGGASIDLYGYTLPLRYYAPVFRRKAEQRLAGKQLSCAQDMERPLGRPDPARFSLLLAHNPLFFEDYVRWGADLILSGHLHGGLVRLPGLGGLLSPDWTFFPRYDAGVFRSGESVMVVGRGIGSSGKLRILNPPEIVLLTLRKRG